MYAKAIPALSRVIQNAEARTATLRMLILVGARVGGTLLTLIYTLMLSRVTSQHDFGLATAAMSTTFLLSVLISMNVEMGSIRYLSKYISEKSLEKASGFIHFCRIIVFFTSSILLAFGVIYYILSGSDRGQTLVYIIAFAAAPVIAMSRVSARHAVVMDAVLGGTLPRILVRPLLFIIFIGLSYAFGIYLSAEYIVAMLLMSAIASNIAQYFLIRRHFYEITAHKPDRQDWRLWIRTGIMLSPLLTMNEFMRDVIIAAASLSLAKDQLALLVISISLIGILNFAVTAVDIAFSPKVARALLVPDPRRCRELLMMGASIKCVAVALVGTVVVLFRYPILSLLGENYLAAGSGLVALLMMPAASAVFGPGDMVLTVLGHQKDVLIATLVGLLGMVGLTVVGGALGGFQVAAVGAALAYTAQQFLLFLFCRRRAGVDPSILGVRAVL